MQHTTSSESPVDIIYPVYLKNKSDRDPANWWGLSYLQL